MTPLVNCFWIPYVLKRKSGCSAIPLVLVMAPSLGTPELVGVIRVSQVLLGAIVGGMTHVLDKKFWEDWNNLSAREDTRSTELRSNKQGTSKFGSSRLRSHVQ
jgi:hypothetical protein